MLEVFFAVTMTSSYEVNAENIDGPYIEKIAVKEKSPIPLGHRLQDGTMISIGDRLRMYVPEKHGSMSSLTSYERRIEYVNTEWWGSQTSEIVALFASREEALICLKNDALLPCDPRWKEQTTKVLDAIEEGHPIFEICRYPGLALPLAL